MPEGDTIHRVAARLAPALEGAVLRRIRISRHDGPLPSPGETIDEVRAVGKHLLVTFGGGLTLRVHLRMTGSWHLYAPGAAWSRPPRSARVVIEVDDWVAVCFSAPDVAVSSEGTAGVAHLGPDLCAGPVDLDAIAERFARFAPADEAIAVVLLDQRIAAGIGNVYKSEVLHLGGVDPRRLVADVDAATVRWLYAEASRLLVVNLGPGSRTTVPGGLAVYGRAGRPCRRCGEVIERIVQGSDGRSTYWCPTCQEPDDRSGAGHRAGDGTGAP